MHSPEMNGQRSKQAPLGGAGDGRTRAQPEEVFEEKKKKNARLIALHRWCNWCYAKEDAWGGRTDGGIRYTMDTD